MWGRGLITTQPEAPPPYARDVTVFAKRPAPSSSAGGHRLAGSDPLEQEEWGGVGGVAAAAQAPAPAPAPAPPRPELQVGTY